MAAICFVTTCMGRLKALRHSLGPMLEQPGGSCVVVDYSCPDGAATGSLQTTQRRVWCGAGTRTL